ncbi:coat protein [viral metagenome]
MKLSAYFNKHSLFERSQFAKVRGERRLTLRTTHSVCGKVGGRVRHGDRHIDYKIDFHQGINNFSGRMVVGGTDYVGVQSSDVVNHAVEKLRPRTSYSFAEVVKTHFDMRAVMYVLGAAATIGIGNATIDAPAGQAGYKTLSSGFAVPNMGDVMLGPSLITTQTEFATFMALLGEAGVINATLLTDDVPGTQGRFMNGLELTSFAVRMSTNILAEASNCLCYGSHKLAYERGKVVGASLNGHTDEGGWIRRMLKTCRYPRSVGIIPGIGVKFNDLPMQEMIAEDEVTQIVVAEMLEFAALFPLADYRLNGCQTVMKSESRAPVPSRFERLGGELPKIMDVIREMLCDDAGVLHDKTLDIGATAEYINDDSYDEHLAVDTFIPWWWVEPAPLLVGKETTMPLPVKHGEIVKLPMFHTKDVEYSTSVLDSDGRMNRGEMMWVVREAGDLRMEGASYLLSSSYCRENGLGLISPVEESPSGVRGSAMFLHSNDGPTLAHRRWITPDNPMPIPREGQSFGDTVFEVTTAAPWESLTPEEAFSGQIESRISFFTTVDNGATETFTTHRHVPQKFNRLVKMTSRRYDVLVSSRVLSMKVGGTVPTPPPAPPLPPVNPPAPEESDDNDDSDEDVFTYETPKISITRSKKPEPEKVEGPLIKLKPSESGVKLSKPVVKTGGLKPDDEPDESA